MAFPSAAYKRAISWLMKLSSTIAAWAKKSTF
jgi:hypothetical protein